MKYILLILTIFIFGCGNRELKKEQLQTAKKLCSCYGGLHYVKLDSVYSFAKCANGNKYNLDDYYHIEIICE